MLVCFSRCCVLGDSVLMLLAGVAICEFYAATLC